MHPAHAASPPLPGLNENPSEKEGKNISRQAANVGDVASMKALPKRKGNLSATSAECEHNGHLNKSPSKKEGKSALAREGMLGESDPQ